MKNFANAAKAFIVKGNKILLIKRRPNDAHRPGQWDLPGGRLEWGENPFLGLEREIKEEIQMAVEIIMPLNIHYFKRDDSQQIQLTVFWCRPQSGKIKLSHEHTDYKWVDLQAPREQFPDWLHLEINNYLTYIKR